MQLAALVATATFVVGCGADIRLPQVELPTFDTSSVSRLLGDAAAEAGRVASSISIDEIPAELAALLEKNDIRLPPLPSNAAEICGAMGVPGVSSLAGAGLSEVIGTFAAGGEVGVIVGVLVTVVFKTCPEWSPHLENAIAGLLDPGRTFVVVP
jgi:hypothetical protein